MNKRYYYQLIKCEIGGYAGDEEVLINFDDNFNPKMLITLCKFGIKYLENVENRNNSVFTYAEFRQLMEDVDNLND